MQGRIVFATGNAGKIKEIRMIMEDTGLEVVSMKDAGIKADIEENGKTYEEKDRKSTRLNSSHKVQSRMPSSA